VGVVPAGLVLNIFLALLPMIIKIMIKQQVREGARTSDSPQDFTSLERICLPLHICAFDVGMRCVLSPNKVSLSFGTCTHACWLALHPGPIMIVQKAGLTCESVLQVRHTEVVSLERLQGMFSQTQIDFGLNRKYFIFLVIPTDPPHNLPGGLFEWS